MSKAKIAALAAMVLGMTSGAVLATATPADAVSCGSPGVGTAAVRELTQDIGHNGPRTVKLQLVNIRSSDYSYAFLTGAGGTGVQGGDSVWVEWKNTSTSPWEKCPASTAATDAQVAVRSTGAHNINHPMRACLSYWATPIYRSTVCTGTFTDHPED